MWSPTKINSLYKIQKHLQDFVDYYCLFGVK